ncbi:RecBCD enzyme subunit RecD [uncultured archaeon]|nr:RecBCD enzyme subunit RecD [uncultured archaeon]
MPFLIDLSYIQKMQIYALEEFKADRYKILRERLIGDLQIEGGEPQQCFYNDKKLNPYQQEAIKYAVGVKDFVLIWGPPGTGKTKIVPEIASNYQHIFENKKDGRDIKILICAWTNTAVDNVVKVLCKQKCDVIRYGKQTTLDDKYNDIKFENIVKLYKEQIEKENLENINKILKNISENEKLISMYKKNIKNCEDEILIINSDISKINIEIKEIIRVGLEKDILNRQDSIKQHIKKIDDINDEIKSLELDISKANDVIKLYEFEIVNLDKNIKILADDISNQYSFLETAKKYLQFIEQNPIKYRAYYHVGLMPPVFHETLIKYNLQRKNHIEVSSCISEIDEKINKLKYQHKETTTQKSGNEHLKDKSKENLIECINAVVLLKHEFVEISNLGKKENEELQYQKVALGSLQNLEIDQYFKNNILKNIMVKQVQNYEKMQNLMKKQNELDNKLKNKKSELAAKEKEINNMIEEVNKLKNDEKIDEKLKNAEVEVLKKHHIIATTNMQASKLFEKVMFDLTIMDEAGAIDLPGALIPILSANKLVFLGDHYQLPPIMGNGKNIESFFSEKGKEESKKFKSSIFELVYEKKRNANNSIMLKKQYRMRKEISDFVSGFYPEKLEAQDKFDLKLTNIQNEILGSKQPFVCFKRDFFSRKGRRSWISENEMRLIKNIVDSYKKECGEKILDEIGIISAYADQAQFIKMEMKSSSMKIDCSTVHKYQGQEKRIIIFSTAMQSSQYFDGEDGKRLLNVAVSRAKEKLILIGSDDLFRKRSEYGNLHRYILKGNGKIIPSYEETIFDPIVKCNKCGDSITSARRFCIDCDNITEWDKAKRTEPDVECDNGTHKVRSTHEKIIDDWLYKHGIEYEYERPLPFHSWCDWYIKSADIYIEYFGYDTLTKNRHRIESKIRKYKKHNLMLIDLYPEDLKNIDKILSERLARFNNKTVRII